MNPIESPDAADTGPANAAHVAPQDAVLEQRLRQGQSDLDDAIALLRALPIGDLPPANEFDPGWGEISR